MDRELLIEIGCEELPASWLPGLTGQLSRNLETRLREQRIEPGTPVESFSTPRRLTACVGRLSERQTDLEEIVTGPAVSAAFGPDGEPTRAAAGFARKHAVEVSSLERLETPKGTYLAHRVRQRGKATVDVIADVFGLVLRDFTFPKQMRWDAYLDDGKGDLVFARPIRWIVLLYGGRVVPFVIRRTEGAQSPNVQDVRSGAQTLGHRFLTTSGRAGRAIKVKTFEDYKTRLLEHFVILDRAERDERIRRELETHARRLGGRVSQKVAGESALLQEVPDLVEYPSVVAGHFPVDFLSLPEEVLTTTMIHHQHYFPVVDDQGELKPAFLAVTNIEAERPELIARNAERVLVARLRDARFFWDEDRKVPLESRLERLATIQFHKKVGTYREKAGRVAGLARWIAAEAWGRPEEAGHAEQAGRLCKTDLATDMVRELTELQGTMGGIYAREEGLPEQVWKAVYFHYLPVGVEADAPPLRSQLGAGAIAWAAVALADKLDSVAGMFAAGERPTGSRDPLGLRRQAQGIVKILTDAPELTGVDARLDVAVLLRRAADPFGGDDESMAATTAFIQDRLAYLLEQRGFDVRNIRAVLSASGDTVRPLDARRKLEALPEFTDSAAFTQLATAFKRVKNIARQLPADRFAAEERARPDLSQDLQEEAERALLDELERRRPVIEGVLQTGEDYRRAFAEAAQFGPPVDRFFTEVFVMTDDERLRTARLRLMTRLRNVILQLADISEIVPEQ